MAKILLKHYLKYNAVLEDKLLLEYIHWVKTSGYDDGIGIYTKNILLHNKVNKDSQGNGALMRNIPFALKLKV